MTGLPLVLIPGLMCDDTVWQPLVPLLADVAHCQLVDHGAADDLAQMARQILDDAPPRFNLAGHSMGGRVALEVVRLAAGRVARLALLDTGYTASAEGAPGMAERAGREALLALARDQGVRVMALQWVQGMLAPLRLADAALVETIVAMFERKSADIFARQIAALLARPDATPVLTALRVPTLVLCGEHDSWATPAQHARIAALVRPDLVDLQLVTDAGHMSTLEQPSAVAQAMRKWLSRTVT